MARVLNVPKWVEGAMGFKPWRALGRYRVYQLGPKAPIKVWPDGRTEGPGDRIAVWEWAK